MSKPSGRLSDMGSTSAAAWLFIQRPGPGSPTKIKRLAARFMEFRRRKREADQSVDTFFNRGATTSRFAYFND